MRETGTDGQVLRGVRRDLTSVIAISPSRRSGAPWTGVAAADACGRGRGRACGSSRRRWPRPEAVGREHEQLGPLKDLGVGDPDARVDTSSSSGVGTAHGTEGELARVPGSRAAARSADDHAESVRATTRGALAAGGERARPMVPRSGDATRARGDLSHQIAVTILEIKSRQTIDLAASSG